MRDHRRRLFAGFALGMLAAGMAHAQAPSGAPITVPGAGRFLFESEVSDYRPEEFVDRRGAKDAFFRSLDLGQALLRFSFSPTSRLALGVELPYRSSRMDVDGAAALTSSGSPGTRLFLDWAPVASTKVDGAVRLAYFQARNGGDRALPVRDGFDRYSVKAWLKTGPALLPPDWRMALGAEAQYGRARSSDVDLADGRFDIRAERRVARLGSSLLFLRGLGGYEIASRAVEEGLSLQDLKLRRAFVGLAASAEWQARVSPASCFDISAERDVYANNSLSGWRLRAGFRTGL